MKILGRCDSLLSDHGLSRFLVFLMVRRSRLIDDLTLYNYRSKRCQILPLWFPLTDRAQFPRGFFEPIGLKSVAQFPGNPAGEILLYSVYITSM